MTFRQAAGVALIALGAMAIYSPATAHELQPVPAEVLACGCHLSLVAAPAHASGWDQGAISAAARVPIAGLPHAFIGLAGSTRGLGGGATLVMNIDGQIRQLRPDRGNPELPDLSTAFPQTKRTTSRMGSTAPASSSCQA